MTGIFVVAGFYGEGVDQLAWCLVAIAGSMVFRGFLSSSGPSRLRMLVVGLLLTGSVFTKQTTIVPCFLLSLVPIVALAVLEPKDVRTGSKWVTSAIALLTFAVTSAVSGVLLQIASHEFRL